MRKKLLWSCLVLSICVVSLFAQQPEGSPKKGKEGQAKGMRGSKGRGGFGPVFSTRWEYAVRTMAEVQDSGEGDLQRGLNKLGESGWELVALDGTFGTGHGNAYFKRTKSGGPWRSDGDAGAPMMPGLSAVDVEAIVGQRPPNAGGGATEARSLVITTSPVPQSKETTLVLTLKNCPVGSMAQMLNSIFGRPGVRVVPDSRTNKLVLIAPENLVPEIRKMIEELDQPAGKK